MLPDGKSSVPTSMKLFFDAVEIMHISLLLWWSLEEIISVPEAIGPNMKKELKKKKECFYSYQLCSQLKEKVQGVLHYCSFEKLSI